MPHSHRSLRQRRQQDLVDALFTDDKTYKVDDLVSVFPRRLIVHCFQNGGCRNQVWIYALAAHLGHDLERFAGIRGFRAEVEKLIVSNHGWPNTLAPHVRQHFPRRTHVTVQQERLYRLVVLLGRPTVGRVGAPSAVGVVSFPPAVRRTGPRPAAAGITAIPSIGAAHGTIARRGIPPARGRVGPLIRGPPRAFRHLELPEAP
mmetsp:Transcript_63413/g.176441  ORF Transcript_63413/g.176441 Transcript_63413/m.176441 type:complete len:203 (-) Transcript_63413:153-761(-)